MPPPPPDGSQGAFGRGAFYRTLTEAVADFTRYGFDSQGRLEYWTRRIRSAAEMTLTPDHVVDAELRRALGSVYAREIDRGLILKRHPGVSRFTLDRVKSKLRSELDRRLLASANLIKLNREDAIATTLRRFTGWATSIPDGGSKVVGRVDTKTGIRKALASLPFEERRVSIDQGHKFNAALNGILAVDAGALAGEWHSHWRQPGYDYRPDHKDRDEHFFVMRGNWALERGLMKASGALYSDQITQPGEDVFCRCYYRYVYALRDLPSEMLTEMGVAELNRARAA